MGTLPQMVSNLTKTDGRDRKSIEHVARLIRGAGYIPNGKRGGGAPQMTDAAAANLIIALNGAEAPTGAVLAIDRFRSLTPMGSDVSETADLPEVLASLASCENFGLALECLIENAPGVAAILYEYLKSKKPKALPEALLRLAGSGVVRLEVLFSARFAEIKLMADGDGILWGQSYSVDDNRPLSFYGLEGDRADRRLSVVIGLPTFMQAWASVHGDGAGK